jgi:hypothetical protein
LVRQREKPNDIDPYEYINYQDIAADQNSIKIWIGDNPEVLDKIGIIIGKGECDA